MKGKLAPPSGAQKSIASFFSKAMPSTQPSSQDQTPPSTLKRDALDKSQGVSAQVEDDVVVMEESSKKTPPASELKKRKEPNSHRKTPVQPIDDQRMRIDGDSDGEEEISMRKCTRRRVVPASMAESSEEEEEEEEEEEFKATSKAAAPSSKPTPFAKSAAQKGGKATAQQPSIPAVQDDVKGKAAVGAASGRESQKGGAVFRESKLSSAEKDKVHQKFIKKVSLMRSSGPEEGGAAAGSSHQQSVGGVLLPMKLEARGAKLTPMEDQVVAIKNKNPDIVLLVECGYKFKFFGRDAEIASRVLNIFHHMDHNFYVASIPTQRVDVHTRRLVEAGYKVGIVRQTETAALKAVSDTKNKGFSRELCEVYTKSTMLVEDVHVLEGAATIAAQASAVYMMCICEEEVGSSGEMEIGMVAVDTGSGDIVYDSFRDDALRSQLETRVSHLQPKELLLADSLTPQTVKLLRRMATGSQARVETISGKHLSKEASDKSVRDLFSSHSEAALAVTNEMGEEAVGCVAEGRLVEQGMNGVLSLPRLIVQCVGGLIHYLKQFNLQQVLRLTGNMWRFSSRTHMLLDSQVLSNLEVVVNETEGTEQGSLVWLLKSTKTAFGARLLRHWVAHPLLDKHRIVDRHDAVEELIDAPAAAEPISALLKGLPDLERAVARIHYGKCAPNELLALLNAFKKVSGVAKEAAELASSLSSSLLRSLIADMPDLSNLILGFLDEINLRAAQEAKGLNYDKKELLLGFERESEYPAIVELKVRLSDVDGQMNSHLSEVRKMLRIPDLEFKSILTTTHLIEVPNAKIAQVPKDWLKINGTKAHARFHTPDVLDLLAQRARLDAKLDMLCADAWQGFLGRVGQSYGDFKNVVQRLAVLDCLFSLAAVAKRGGWVRPNLSDQQVLHVVQGRHPMVDAKMGSGYVPNDIFLSNSREKAMVITGPNMGGKSSYIRQNALLVIMAQVGSFVPAESAEMGVFDAIFTRMGASDSISTGRSTFLIETQEAADIMHKATARSLVVMDELGRGTSTHDGTAIAYATLKHLVTNVRCFTLFVTHYQHICQMQNELMDKVGNYHMSFLEDGEGENRISFMYRLVKGRADRSFGLNVATLAHLPPNLIEQAKLLSTEMEANVDERLRGRTAQVFKRACALGNMACVDREALLELRGEARTLIDLEKL